MTLPEDKEQKLIVPLNYITAETKNWDSYTNIWIKDITQAVENVTSKNNTKWVLFNVHRSTPCRINYDVTNWNLLIRQLQEDPNVIPPINRAQLVDDAFQLARHGYLDYSVVLNLTSYLKDKEKHYIPWAVFFDNLEDMYLVMYKTGEFGYFQVSFQHIFLQRFESTVEPG